MLGSQLKAEGKRDGAENGAQHAAEEFFITAPDGRWLQVACAAEVFPGKYKIVCLKRCESFQTLAEAAHIIYNRELREALSPCCACGIVKKVHFFRNFETNREVALCEECCHVAYT